MKTIVQIEKVYADGSGAPAIVVCMGHRFAAEFVVEPRLTSLTNHAVSRKVVDAAKRAYAQALRLHVDVNADWYNANRAMYAASI